MLTVGQEINFGKIRAIKSIKGDKVTFDNGLTMQTKVVEEHLHFLDRKRKKFRLVWNGIGLTPNNATTISYHDTYYEANLARLDELKQYEMGHRIEGYKILYPNSAGGYGTPHDKCLFIEHVE